MAFVYGDRVKESSGNNGTGNLTLEGAASGFQTFEEGIGEGNETYYVIINDADGAWEIGIGTYSAGQLLRDTVLASTNGGALVNFGDGTKTVGATISKQFYEQVLVLSTHNTLDHAGLPGVPDPETFTSMDHESVTHIGLPFNLLDAMAHEAVNHTTPPLNLLDTAGHNALNHAGVLGVNSFDQTQHSVTDHDGVLGVPAPEVFTAAVHAATNHAGLPGVGGVPSVDDSAEVVFASAGAINLNLNITAGTWTVFAYGAWRSRNLDQPSDLRIASVAVSTLIDDNNADGTEYYTHYGFQSGIVGPQTVFIDFDAIDGAVTSTNPAYRIFAFAVRTS
jgi:hypothetical protein